jgi:hypothetical protein
MCINYVHSDRSFIIWETFFVHQLCNAGPAPSGSSHNQPRQITSALTASAAVDTVRDKNALLAPIDHTGAARHRVAEDAETGRSKKPGCA